jgi:hypothetical protein
MKTLSINKNLEEPNIHMRKEIYLSPYLVPYTKKVMKDGTQI